MLTRAIKILSGSVIVLLAACGTEPAGGAAEAAPQQARAGANGNENASANISTQRAGVLSAGLYTVVQTGDVEIDEERCIQAGDIAAGRFVGPGAIGEGWTVGTNRMSGGKIDLAASHASGGRMTISGTYGKDAFTVDAKLEMKVNGKPHVVNTRQRGVFASPNCPEDMD